MYDMFGRYIPDEFQPPFCQRQNVPRQEVVKVHGRAGAEMYQMGVNSSALLLDDSAAIVWFKRTDGAGYTADLIPYDISEHQTEPQISNNEILERIKRLEDIVNGKSDSSNAATKQKQEQ